MTAFEFFISILSLGSTYINSFVSVIFSTPAFFIPFCILVGCSFVGIVYRLVKG